MKRGTDHRNAQRVGKERDLFTCQICGSKDHAEGHHLFDYSFGGAPDEDNIITLCHECHSKVHQGVTDLFKL